MIEIAISLAVIGIALVAIIGVLPLGMNVQRENREATVINQDATVFMEAIRSGARGLDDLTNYVYAITNNWTEYANHVPGANGVNGYGYVAGSIAAGYPGFSVPINSGTNIIGLLSTPQFIDANGVLSRDVDIYYNGNFISNHVVAYVRSISGAAVDKPPQDNQIIQQDAFGYRLLCVNTVVQTDTNVFDLKQFPDGPPAYTRQLAANLHELRLTFQWPVLPGNRVGGGRQTFRSLVAGQIEQDPLNVSLHFYQSQSFTNSP